MDFYKSKKIRSVLAFILIIAWLFVLDFNSVLNTTNIGVYLGILSMVLVIIQNYLEYRKKQ